MRNIFFIVFILIAQFSVGQYTSEESDEKTNPLSKLAFKDRLYTGGGMSFSAQNSWIFAEASPFVGYRITEKYSVGLGAKYIYIGSRQFGINYSVL